MDTSEPTVIKRHWFGLFVIGLVGSLLFGALFAAGLYNYQLGDNSQLAALLLLVALAVATGMLVQGYVYEHSLLVLRTNQLIVTRRLTIFASRVAACEWNQVQDVQVKRPSLWSQLLGYGTLTVQTAGERPNLRFRWTPQVEQWRAELMRRAIAAETPVTVPAL